MTLVELMVVTLVAAIIIALAVQSLRGSRTTGGKMEVRAVAMRYADAVDRFKADHGRRVPVLASSSPTWPAANAVLGPKTTVNLGSGSTTKHYVKQPLPEILERANPLNAEIVAAPGPIASQGGTIVYERSTAYQFTMTAYWNGDLVCVAGDTDPGDNVC